MIDLLHAVADCGDLIQTWDVSRRPEGVVLRATSRELHSSEEAAVEAAKKITLRAVPTGYDVEVLSAGGRPVSAPDAGWRAVVEVALS
jgi:hypothetical protein